MRLLRVLCACLLCFSGLAAPITHVVQISVDGLGGYYLQSYLSNAPAEFPNFVRLMTEGASTMNARCDYFASETIPNHATMFTGRPVLQPAGFPDTVHHGYANNFPGSADTFHNSGNPNVPYKASFFDVAHDHGLTTAFYAGKTRLSICDRSYNEINGALDMIDEDNGRDKIDVLFINDGPSITQVFDPLVQRLASTPNQFSFVHSLDPDITGHMRGWGSSFYSNAVRAVDQQLGRVFAAISQNPVLSNKTAIILTADHGGGGVLITGHSEPHHILNYTIPFFLWGPGIPPGENLYRLFSNRRDPGTNRTDYTVAPQPIRDGDSGNLALELLGLPAIPDSFMIPVFAVPPLSIIREYPGDQIKVRWHDPDQIYILQSTTSLQPPVDWQPVTTGLTQDGEFRSHSVSSTGPIPRFFRLRKN